MIIKQEVTGRNAILNYSAKISATNSTGPQMTKQVVVISQANFPYLEPLTKTGLYRSSLH